MDDAILCTFALQWGAMGCAQEKEMWQQQTFPHIGPFDPTCHFSALFMFLGKTSLPIRLLRVLAIAASTVSRAQIPKAEKP